MRKSPRNDGSLPLPYPTRGAAGAGGAGDPSPEGGPPGSCEEDDSGKRLMLAFQQGDQGAFDRIVLEYQGPVKRFLAQYLQDRNRTEDLTQEVFIRVYRSRRRYRPAAAFRTWLFTIATRLALNEVRRLRRHRRHFVEAVADPARRGTPGWETARDRRQPSPAAELDGKELADVLARLIDELPPSQKAALLLSTNQGMPYKDIAEALETTVTAVKSLILRARETLRARLDPYLRGMPLRAEDAGAARGRTP